MEKIRNYEQLMKNEIAKQCAKNGITVEDLEIMYQEEKEAESQAETDLILDGGIKATALSVGKLPVDYIW